MPLRVPYYNLHQIVTGQYTVGNEFVLADGTDYIGEYHIIPTGQRFTGSRPIKSTVELFVKRFTITPDTLLYNRINDTEANKYVNPVLHYPLPTTEDYGKGVIQRYFVQKRNNPRNTILEINGQQFNSINTRNTPGINGVIWNNLILDWRISKIPKDDVFYFNQTTLQRNEDNFPGIGAYITNPLEFWKD